MLIADPKSVWLGNSSLTSFNNSSPSQLKLVDMSPANVASLDMIPPFICNIDELFSTYALPIPPSLVELLTVTLELLFTEALPTISFTYDTLLPLKLQVLYNTPI